ncbi:MAG: HlyD family type I secretion periplasmic adaptor subunit, partial [Bradyrhizobium sp.]|nr:HlyD family type I secretion periplasmic adaptor subunit [Bradyrhizobium sp.]
MSTALARPAPNSLDLGAPARPDDSARGPVRAGWIIEGNRKSIEHPDGGRIREVLVHEGDHVKAGDIVLVLDDTDDQAQVSLLSQQQAQLMATEARLRAEYTGLDAIVFPPELTAQGSDPEIATAISDQQKEFETRRAALAGNRKVLEQRVAQYTAQIAGLRAQLPPLQDQLKSMQDERVSLDDALKKGLVTRTRSLELDRRISTTIGQQAEIAANIATSQDAIGEVRQQIAQLDKDQSEKIAADLRDVRTRLADVSPRLAAAKVALDRTQIRTPYAGTVVDLAVFSVGEVVGRGERLLDVVPEASLLDVEAKIRVEDISDIRPGMRAEVHFTSYKQRTLPLIHGLVAEISADRLTDERTQIPYYTARIDVDAA